MSEVTDYEKEVKKVYPKAYLDIIHKQTMHGTIPCGAKIVKPPIFFGIPIIWMFGTQIGFGYTEQGAWESAYEFIQANEI